MGVNTGRALMSIGDDFFKYGVASEALESRKEIAAANNDTKLMLQQMREEMARNLLEVRSTLGLGGGGGGGTGLVGRAVKPEEVLAAEGGFDSLPEFDSTRERFKAGPTMETKATADSPGMEYLAPEDRAQLESAGGMKGETPGSMQAAKGLPKLRESLILSQVPAKDRDDFEKGRSEKNRRDRAWAEGADISDVARRAGAEKGEAMHDVKDDTAFDRYAPPKSPTSTPLGEAKIKTEGAKAEAWRSESKKDDRTDPNRPRGGRRSEDKLTPGEKERLADARGQVKQAAEERRKPLVKNDAKASAKAEAAYREAVRYRDDLLENLTGAGIKDRTGAADAAPAAAPAPAPSSTPPVNLLKEGVNTRFKNGQVWTLKNGKPVKVG